MNNKEIVIEIFNKLENGHINLWHDITKEEMYSKIESINWNTLSDIEFDYEMMKLFSLFKDAHTRYFVKNKPLESKLIYKNSKLYLLKENRYIEVNNINGIDVDELHSRFEEIVFYETNEWKNKQIEIAFNSRYHYEMIGLKNDLVALLENGELATLIEASKEELERRFKEFKPYSYKIINGVLYLRYSACRDDSEIAFSDFVNLIRKDIKHQHIKQYILDVRGNAGGNSEILNSFQNLVREEKMDGVLLMDEGVFSSGRFALAKFKKEFNTLFIGTPSGGAAKSYGYNNNDSVENKRFSYSIRHWDFSDVFKTDGAIIPDILIETSIEDLENGKDKVLDEAFRVLKENKKSYK